MVQLNYKVTNNESNLRRENWENFIDNIKWNKKNNIAILSIHFNNFKNTQWLISYIKKENKGLDIDIIIIENSTKKDEEVYKLSEYISKRENIILIKPIHNVWSAGGYALGMEYILDKEYEYFFIVEDDVIFLEEGVFDDMSKYADTKTLTFINECKNCRSSSQPTEKWKSRRVQIAGYPTNFIKNIGVIDPRYFFRGEDLEWWWRIQKGIKKFWYKTKVIDHNYLHPYLKSVNGNYARFYFSIRNQLLSLEKHFTDNIVFFVILFFYVRTAVTRLIVNKEKLIMKSCYDALSDFLLHRFSFENNRRKISLFLKNGTKQENPIWISSIELSELCKKMYMSQRIMCITGTDREGIPFSKKIRDIWKHGLIISSSSTVFYPLTLLASKVICINEFDLIKNTVSIHQYTNKHTFLNIWWITISFVVSLMIIIILSIIITISVWFSRLYKNIC